MLEDSLERILGDKSINVIVMHDKNYSTDRYASFGEVKASFDTLNGCAIRTSAVNLTAISNLSGVEMVYEDKEVHTCLDSALLEIKAKEVVTGTAISGDGVTIAVIDTGIDANHECLDDLDDDPETNDPKVIAFMDFVKGKNESYDDNGHGTHCAAVAAGTGGKSRKYVGVAPGATLVGVKALDSRGNGYISDVISGIEWCMHEKEKYNIKVISLSLGGDDNSDGSTPLLQCNSSLTPTELKSILLETAEDKWPTGPDKKYGYGVLDVESAVNRALSKLGPSTLAVAKLNMSGNVTAN